MELTAHDELQHTPADEWLWRESLYFSFHDASGNVGGMTTIGVLPNQNRAQGHAVVFLDAHRVLLYYTESPLVEGETGLCAVPGISYKMLHPLQRWRFELAADCSAIDPYEFVRGIRPAQTTIPAQFDLNFDALSPAYEYPQEVFPLLTGTARHFEQTGRVDGKVTIGQQLFAVAGFGFRDHSWGIRDLAKTDDIVGICAQIGPHFTANAFQATRQGQQIGIGFISRDGVNTPLDYVRIAVETDPLSRLPKAGQAEIGTVAGQRFVFQAEVKSVLPVLLDHGRDRLFWYECSTLFRYGQQTGFGTLSVTKLVRRDRDS
jgi:hypothetical protein